MRKRKVEVAEVKEQTVVVFEVNKSEVRGETRDMKDCKVEAAIMVTFHSRRL